MTRIYKKKLQERHYENKNEATLKKSVKKTNVSLNSIVKRTNFYSCGINGIG
jgi:hypothetical protein